MSGHSEDPVAEESQRFFTFFNLSMILVAITGLEIVIIYIQSFEGSFCNFDFKICRSGLVVYAFEVGQNS